jgi:hypothetical protein
MASPKHRASAKKQAQARPSSGRSHAKRSSQTARIVAQVPDDAKCTDCGRKIALKSRLIISDERIGRVTATLHIGCYTKRTPTRARLPDPVRARRRHAAPDLLDQAGEFIGDVAVAVGELAFEGLKFAARNPKLVRLLIEQSGRR